MYEYSALILRVIDGDTVLANVDLGFHIRRTMPLRLFGIDAPETQGVADRQPGLAAAAYLGSLVAVKSVLIRTQLDKGDKYGRCLAEIFIPGEAESVNARMISAGHAVAYDGGKR